MTPVDKNIDKNTLHNIITQLEFQTLQKLIKKHVLKSFDTVKV